VNSKRESRPIEESASKHRDSSHFQILVDFGAATAKQRVEANRVAVRCVKQVLEQRHCRVGSTQRHPLTANPLLVRDDKETLTTPKAQVNSDIEVSGSLSDTWMLKRTVAWFNFQLPASNHPPIKTPKHLLPKHPLPRHHLLKHQIQHIKSIAAMCISEKLPPVDVKDRVLDNLDDVVNPGADMPDDADIFAAALNNIPLNGDFLWQAAGNRRDNEPEGPRPWEAFEEIFTSDEGITRRDDRTTTNPTPDVRNFVICWYLSVHVTADPEHELSTRPIGYSRFFRPFIRRYLPAKLDLNSWVGDAVVRMLSKHQCMEEGSLFQWQPWMGTDEARRTPPPAGFEFLDKYAAFLGTPGEGRLVWRKDRWGVQIPTSQDEAKKQTMIEGKLSRAEDSLVRLSIRIANWLANWLVFSYAHKMMHLLDGVDRERLTPEDITNAVIEILGNEWSELPFDHEGKLKSWKNKRDIPMNKSQFDHILGDSDDQDADY